MEGKTPDVNKVAWAYTAGALWVIIILGMLVFTPSPSLTFAAPGGGDDDPISLVESFRRLSSAVGALYVQTNDGDMKFNCTVTVIGHEEERTTLITAAHCVSRGETYMISLDGMRFYSARVWKLPPELVKNTATRGYGEPKVDIAILTVRQILAVNPVLVGPDIGTDAGKAVITVGYPLGVTKISYNGIIAGRMTRPGAEKDGYLLLQIFGAPGSSGSAVVDQRSGKIVGILVAGKEGNRGLPVIFAVPIRYLDLLIPAVKEGKRTPDDVAGLVGRTKRLPAN